MTNFFSRSLASVLSIPSVRNAVANALGGYQGGTYADAWGHFGVNRDVTRDLERSKYGAAMAYKLIYPCYRSVNLLSQAVASVPWSIKNKVTGEVVDRNDEYSYDHPLSNMFFEASRYHKESLFKLWEISLALFGENFLEKARNRFAFPAGLRWLNPLAIDIRALGGKIQGFQYQTAGGGHVYPPHDVSYDRIPDPEDDLHGYSPTMAAMSKINVDKNAHEWWSAHFRNGARPDIIIAPKSDNNAKTSFTDQDQRTIAKSWANFTKGASNAGRAIVPPYPVDVNIFEPVDLSKQIPLSDAMETAIFSLYGVNRPAAGDTTDTRYKTGEEIFSSFYGGTIAEICKDIALEVNITLMPFAENCYVEDCQHVFSFDLESLDVMTDSDKTKQEQARANLAAGAITLNQFLEQIGEKPVDQGNVYYLPMNVKVTPASELVPLPATPAPSQAPTMGVGESPAVEPLITPAQEFRADETTGVPGYVCITLANNESLVDLQNSIRGVLGDAVEYQWNDQFHCTLVYCPDATDDQLRSVLAVKPVQPVGLYGNRLILLGEADKPALCIELAATPELLSVQDAMYHNLAGAGATISEYSDPAKYRPHITLAYCPPDFSIAKLAGVPVDIHILAEKIAVQRDEYETMFAIPCVTEGVEETRKKAHQQDALSELEAWKKVAFKGTRRRFEPLHTRGDLSDWIEEQLPQAGSDKGKLKEVFAEAVRRASYRAITETESAFAGDFAKALDSTALGDLDRRNWAIKVRALIRQYGRQAYLDGMRDGGVDPEQIDPEDEDQIAGMIRDQSQYVTNLGATLKFEGITQTEADTKPDLWVNKTITPFYTAGLASANRNQMMEFTGEDGEETCDTCARLKGQRHRLKDWRRKGYVPREDTDNFQCGGWACQHKLVRVSGSAKGSW